MKTRTAKSSALINKTLELHMADTDCLSRSGILFITHVHSHIYARARSSTLPSPLLRSGVAFRSARAAYTREIATLCLSLSLSTSSLLPLRAGETRALQSNKGNLRCHPFTRYSSYLGSLVLSRPGCNISIYEAYTL